MTTLNHFLNTTQAAAVIGCSVAHVRYMLIHGQLSGRKLSGRAWMIARSEARRMARVHHKNGRPRGRSNTR
jgi:hypothetical protein